MFTVSSSIKCHFSVPYNFLGTIEVIEVIEVVDLYTLGA